MSAGSGVIRFLFAMFQGGGNIPLILPIVSELVARGHQVRVLAGPGTRRSRLPVSERFRAQIRAAGAVEGAFEEPAVHPLDWVPVRGVVRGWTPALYGREPERARVGLWSPVWAHNVTHGDRCPPPCAAMVAALSAPKAGLLAQHHHDLMALLDA